MWVCKVITCERVGVQPVGYCSLLPVVCMCTTGWVSTNLKRLTGFVEGHNILNELCSGTSEANFLNETWLNKVIWIAFLCDQYPLRKSSFKRKTSLWLYAHQQSRVQLLAVTVWWTVFQFFGVTTCEASSVPISPWCAQYALKITAR